MSTATVAMAPDKLVYGAKELKIYIQKNTYRSFAYALSLVVLLLLISFIVNYINSRQSIKLGIQLAKPISLSDLPPPPTPDAPPPPPPSATVTAPTVAGTPIPVPETMLTPDMKEFANVDEIAKAPSVVSEGPIGDVQIDTKQEVVKEAEPASDDFVAVEKEPSIDIGELQKRVEYPAMARSAGLEGTVSIRVLVGKDGRPMRSEVLNSVNKVLDEAATKAVMASVFSPGIQNGSPTLCWVTVPVKFKLR